AQENGVGQLENFIENDEAPALKEELNEMQTEIQEQKSEEQDFNEVMKELAQEGELTEKQLDKLQSQQMSVFDTLKMGIQEGALSASNFSQALKEASGGLSDLMSGAGSLMSGGGSLMSGAGSGLEGIMNSDGASDMLSSLGQASETLAEGKKSAMQAASKAESEASDAASKASS
ncbi:MAG: hypothetical protein ABEK04_00905, partial [Candidatus Nanohalobium sp.]